MKIGLLKTFPMAIFSECTVYTLYIMHCSLLGLMPKNNKLSIQGLNVLIQSFDIFS